MATPPPDYGAVVSTLIPTSVRAYLDRHDPNKTLQPFAGECFAATVMVDVSGYSKLTAKLAERGSLGTELLSKTMNGYWDKIIAIIFKHGGDIVKFAGDALIFYWVLDTEQGDFHSLDADKGELVVKAAECCLDLLRQVGEYPINIPECDVTMLRIHLGVGAGRLYNVHVGGEPGRWEHFVAGDAINQLGTVLDLAKPGQLAISHQALRWFSVVIDIASVDVGPYDKRCIILNGMEKRKRKIPCPHSDEAKTPSALSSKVDAQRLAMYEKFANQSGLFKLRSNDAPVLTSPAASELRQVTTIFVKIGGSMKFETDESLGPAQEAMSSIQRVLKKQEGVLRQFIVDDKGAVVLMYFGLPPMAHENDPLLAIDAAMQIGQALRRIFDDFSIGVGTGMTWVGGVGNMERADYAVVGDSVNMAARLMCNAKSKLSVVCDEKSYELCKEKIKFDDLGTIKVKGKSEPIRIFHPVEKKQQQKKQDIRPNTNVVGRTKTLDAIRAAMKEYAEVGKQTTLVVEGEEGMGLGTIHDYIVSQASLNSHKYWSREMDKATPYYTYQDVVLNLFIMIHDINSGDSNLRNGKRGSLMDQLAKMGDVDKTDAFIPPVLEESESKLSMDTSPHKQSPSQAVSGEARQRLADQLRFAQTSMAGDFSTLSRASMLRPVRGSHLQGEGNNFGTTTRIHAPRPQSTVFEQTDGSAEPVSPVQQAGLGRNYSTLEFNHAAKSSTSSLPQAPDQTSPYKGPKRLSYISDVRRRPSITVQLTTSPEIEQKIISGLQIMGENPQLAPLFSMIMPISFTETDTCNKIDKRMRIHELTSLLVRLFGKVSFVVPTLLLLDQAHYQDPLSWRLTEAIVRGCPKLMVCLFTHPESHYPDMENASKTISSIKKQDQTILLQLEGLTLVEAKELILRTMQFYQDISDDIVQNIWNRSRGNPFYVLKLVGFLEDSDCVEVTAEGILQLKPSVKNFDSVVPGANLESIVIAQFDKLDTGFQAFLRVACVMGHQFYLQDVLSFLEASASRCNVNQTNIMHLDRYSFLRKGGTASERQEGVRPMSDPGTKRASADGQEQELDEIYVFTSQVIQRAIYNMMAFSQRQTLHLDVGKFYEQEMLENKRDDLLLSVYDHYVTSENKDKVREYIEDVSHHYYKVGAMHEAVKHYTKLFAMYQADVAAKKVKPVDTKRMSDWHRELGDALMATGDFKEAESNLHCALKSLGFAFNQATVKKFKIQQLPTLPQKGTTVGSPGGSQELSMPKAFRQDDKHSRVINKYSHNIRMCLLSLSDLYYQLEDQENFRLAVLMGLNTSQQQQRKDVQYAQLLAMEGLSLLMNEKTKDRAWPLLTQAENIIDDDVDPISTHHNSVYEYLGTAYFARGSWKDSQDRFDCILKMGNGDRFRMEKAAMLTAWMLFQNGEYDKSLKVGRDLFFRARNNDQWTGQCLGTCITVSNFVTRATTDEQLNYTRLVNDIMRLGELPSETTLGYRIIFDGLQADTTFRLKVKQNSIWGRLRDAVKPLTKVRNHHWAAMIGIEHMIHALFAGFKDQRFEVKNGAPRDAIKTVREVAKAITLALKQFDQFAVAVPLMALADGLVLLLNGKQKPAVARWNKGLSIISETSFPYLSAVLHSKIATYTKDTKEREYHEKKAADMFSDLGANPDTADVKDSSDYSHGVIQNGRVSLNRGALNGAS